MGRQWIVALGLGKSHNHKSAFHVFCREQDVEGRVKAGVVNGFELQEEMEAAWKKSQGAPTQTQGRSSRKRKAADTRVNGDRQPTKIKRELEVDCNTLKGKRVWRNFKQACTHYKFPGSYQVGSYGPNGKGMVRTYSNATPGKDKVLADGAVILYRLKDEKCRAQFNVNLQTRKAVLLFRKVAAGVMELGPYLVEGFISAGKEDQPDFGAEFVHFVEAPP